MMGKIPPTNIGLKRAYEPPAPEDGARILIDGLWPRGRKKEALALDEWVKDLAPTPDLRKWFGHDPARWAEFKRRYARELSQHADALDDLRARARAGRITLVYAARDEEHNNAVVLREALLSL